MALYRRRTRLVVVINERMGVEKSAPFLLFILFLFIIKKINTEIKMSLKGTIRFVLEPDYNQEESDPKIPFLAQTTHLHLTILRVCK